MKMDDPIDVKETVTNLQTQLESNKPLDVWVNDFLPNSNNDVPGSLLKIESPPPPPEKQPPPELDNSIEFKESHIEKLLQSCDHASSPSCVEVHASYSDIKEVKCEPCVADVKHCEVGSVSFIRDSNQSPEPKEGTCMEIKSPDVCLSQCQNPDIKPSPTMTSDVSTPSVNSISDDEDLVVELCRLPTSILDGGVLLMGSFPRLLNSKPPPLCWLDKNMSARRLGQVQREVSHHHISGKSSIDVIVSKHPELENDIDGDIKFKLVPSNPSTPSCSSIQVKKEVKTEARSFTEKSHPTVGQQEYHSNGQRNKSFIITSNTMFKSVNSSLKDDNLVVELCKIPSDFIGDNNSLKEQHSHRLKNHAPICWSKNSSSTPTFVSPGIKVKKEEHHRNSGMSGIDILVSRHPELENDIAGKNN